MARNLDVISEMKRILLETFLSDEEIMKIVENKAAVTLPNMSMRYTQVVPWKKVPKTQEEAKTFISFEVNGGAEENCAVKNFMLYVWVMTHESLMPFDKKTGVALGLPDRGVRVDVLASKIDRLLNGNSRLGFGKLKVERSPAFDPIDGYHGRLIQYSVMGWNRCGDPP